MTSLMQLGEKARAQAIEQIGQQEAEKRAKYGNRTVDIDGQHFDSQSEYARWRELKALERAGQISELKRQVPYPLVIGGVLPRPVKFKSGRQAKYIADFSYIEDGKRVVEDRKGFQTAESKLKVAVVEAIYGITVRITRQKGAK